MDEIYIEEQSETVQKLDHRLWFRLIPYLQPYRRELILAMVCLAYLGLHDVLMTYLTKYLIDVYIVPGNLDQIASFFFVYAGLTAGMGFAVYQFIRLAGLLEAGIAKDIRQKGFEKLQVLSKGYFDRQPAGRIMARLTSDTVKLGEFISWGLVDMVWGITMMSGIILVMLIVDVRLALITLSVIPLLVLASWYFQRKIVELQRVVRRLNGKITGAISEGILGARTTKTLVIEEKIEADFLQMTGEMRQKSIRSAYYSALFQPVVINIGAVGTVLALTFGGQRVLGGLIGYGTLVLFINYSVQFFEPIREMARILTEMQSAQASAERILDLLDTRSDIEDTPEVIARYGTVLSPKVEAFSDVRGDVQLENINFYYKRGEPIFMDLNLQVEAGTSVALVGPTGSGKSSLVNLICRFYEPQSGQILIDGIDIRERSISWLHAFIGYVQQTPHLFKGTIRENIRYGNLHATEEDIYRAAELVGAHSLINALPKGYDTEVGEGGSLLSTGQKQIIAFARAVIANPRIFILDEATSNIDTESEKLIQEALRDVLRGRTSFIIAHRLSTIRNCDRILVLRDGEIIEDGNHEELLAQKGNYWQLYTNQYIQDQEKELLGREMEL